MIEFKGVTKVYGNGAVALDGLNLFIDKGEFVFVVGRSGAGKSTMIKLLLREEIPTNGTIIVGNYNLKTIRNKQIPYMRRKLGVVFQDFRLIPTMTAYENVAFAMRVTNIAAKDIRKRVPYILHLVGLTDKARCYPEEMSGGEQQRVALARALVHNPPVIIADEPTGNIDPVLSYEIMELLSEINKLGTTIVVVTHEQAMVEEFKRRTIVLEDGKLIADRKAALQNGRVSAMKMPLAEEPFEGRAKERDRTTPVPGREKPADTKAVPKNEPVGKVKFRASDTTKKAVGK